MTKQANYWFEKQCDHMLIHFNLPREDKLISHSLHFNDFCQIKDFILFQFILFQWVFSQSATLLKLIQESSLNQCVVSAIFQLSESITLLFPSPGQRFPLCFLLISYLLLSRLQPPPLFPSIHQHSFIFTILLYFAILLNFFALPPFNSE